MKPKRIQRQRGKGWKNPPNTVYVGRPTKWGNPFRLMGDMIYIDASHRRKILSPWVYFTLGDKEDVVQLFEHIVNGTTFVEKEVDCRYWVDHFSNLDLSELRGKNLSCWCPIGSPCHADILLELANETETSNEP